MPWVSHELKSGTTTSKMAAYQCTSVHVYSECSTHNTYGDQLKNKIDHSTLILSRVFKVLLHNSRLIIQKIFWPFSNYFNYILIFCKHTRHYKLD
jgi:hypothetical protein